MSNANDAIMDRMVMHAHYLERLKSHEANLIYNMYAKVLADLEGKIAARILRASQGTLTTKRLEDLRSAIAQALDLTDIAAFDRAQQVAMMQTEAEFTMRLMGGQMGADISLALPTVGQLRAIIGNAPFRGKLHSHWWKALERGTREELLAQIRIGMIEGESAIKIASRIDIVAGQTTAQARALTKTATAHFNAQAREATYEANEDILSGVQYMATLDGRTTEICMALDGQVFPIGEGPRPPQHFNCRSQTMPLLKSGGNVERQTYGEWLGKQTKAKQNDALGPTRAKLWREGKVKIDKFVSDDGRPLTLDQLRVKEGLTAEDIKVQRSA